MPSLDRQGAPVGVHADLGDRDRTQMPSGSRLFRSGNLGRNRFGARDLVLGDAEPLREPVGHRARNRGLGDIEVDLDRLGVGERGDDPGVSTHRKRPQARRQAFTLGRVVGQECDPKHRFHDTDPQSRRRPGRLLCDRGRQEQKPAAK